MYRGGRVRGQGECRRGRIWEEGEYEGRESIGGKDERVIRKGDRQVDERGKGEGKGEGGRVTV